MQSNVWNMACPDKNVTWVVYLLMRGGCKTIRYKKSPSDWMGFFCIKAWQ
jgi:hypothetical protein